MFGVRIDLARFADLATLGNFKPAQLDGVFPVFPTWLDSKIPSSLTPGIPLGWGITESGSRSDELLKAYIPYLTSVECVARYSQTSVNIYSSFMCAGGFNRTESCKGDSGRIRNKNEIENVIGICNEQVDHFKISEKSMIK